MTADVTIKDGGKLTPHPLRAAILSEVHARPFTPIETPRRVLHFAFDTAGDAAKRDRAALADLCARRQLEPLKASAKHHRVVFGGAMLRWEQHSEFTTYTWELPSPRRRRRSSAAPVRWPRRWRSLPQPGPLLVALDLHLLAEKKKKFAVENLFDRASLAVAENSDGDALFATDFQADPAGFVRILVLDRGLGAERAGARGAARRRARNLSHAGAARPAGGAAADALDQPHREAARRSDRGNAARRQARSTIIACSTN